MTPEEQAIVKEGLKELSEILYRKTVPKELKTFKAIENGVREHLLKKITPETKRKMFCLVSKKI